MPPPPSSVRSCTRVLRPFHFAFHFITNFFLFSLLFPLPPPLSLPALILFLVGFVQSFANYNDSYQSQSSPEGSASPIGRSTGAEQCGVRVAVRSGAGRHGHLMKRNDNKLFKHYLRFHISVCQAFPSFLPFLLLFLFLCYFVLFAYFFYSVA